MDLLPPCLAWYELWKAHGYPSRRVWSHLAMSNNTVKKNNPTPYLTLESTIINHRTNAVLTWRSCTAEHSIFGAWKPQAHNGRAATSSSFSQNKGHPPCPLAGLLYRHRTASLTLPSHIFSVYIIRILS